MIKLMKLITGDLIIGNISDDKRSIENPLFLMPTEQGFAIMDIVDIFSEEKTLKIDGSHVLWSVVPRPEIEDQYKTKISGIITPSTKLYGV